MPKVDSDDYSDESKGDESNDESDSPPGEEEADVKANTHGPPSEQLYTVMAIEDPSDQQVSGSRATLLIGT